MPHQPNQSRRDSTKQECAQGCPRQHLFRCNEDRCRGSQFAKKAGAYEAHQHLQIPCTCYPEFQICLGVALAIHLSRSASGFPAKHFAPPSFAKTFALRSARLCLRCPPPPPPPPPPHTLAPAA